MKQRTYSSVRALGALTFATAIMLPSIMTAGEVQLTSNDGTLDMRGEFISFEDNTYLIGTPLGELRVSASRVSCTGADCPQLEAVVADVYITGSDTVGLGLMPLLLEGYSAELGASATLGNVGQDGDLYASLVSDEGFGDELASYLVSSAGSADGFSGLLDESALIGMSSRRILRDEARALRDAGAGNMVSPEQEHIVAVDSLVVVVHPDNPIQELTTEQLQDIYTGRVQNWSEVGGPDAPINVITRQEGSGTRTVFEQRVFGENEAPLPGTAEVAETNSTASQRVNEDPYAISYVGFAFQRGAKPLTLINECGLRMTPDAFSARTEEYALQRRLYMYTRADTIDASTGGFVDFVKSPAADAVIGKAGFIGFGVDRRAQSVNDARGVMLSDPDVPRYEAGFMQDMLNTMVEYDRLSTTFRFGSGSSRLDERGVVDMRRLVSFLETQPAGSEVLVVGFTDDVGEFDGNRELSANRAAQIAELLQAEGAGRLGNISITSAGYGEIAPSGCNVNEEGRRINRRVEVWIKNPS